MSLCHRSFLIVCRYRSLRGSLKDDLELGTFDPFRSHRAFARKNARFCLGSVKSKPQDLKNSSAELIAMIS